MQRFITPHLVTTCHVEIAFLPLLKPMQLPDRGLLVQSASLTCSRLTPYDCGAAVISRSAGAQITGVRVGLGTDQITTTISTTEYQFGSNFRYLRVHLDEREKRESERKDTFEDMISHSTILPSSPLTIIVPPGRPDILAL